MASSPVTEQELLAEIHKATKKTVGGEGLRVVEIVELTGEQRHRVEKAIALGLKQGTIRRTTKVIERIDGAMKRTPSYVFLKKHGRQG